MAYVKRKVLKPVTIRNAEIMFKNFAGKKRVSNDGVIVNEEGKRNFCVVIPDDIAEKLREDGWNIRISKPRDEDEQPKYYVKVIVNYNYEIPPEVHLLSGHSDTILDEDSIGSLDFADIREVPVITVKPSYYGANGNVAVYLNSMAVVQEEDELRAFIEEYRNEHMTDSDAGGEDLPF